MEDARIKKTRASTSDEARRYRQQGYDDALRFAMAIGLNEDYKNDPKAKKDVIDPSGDAHSIKGGQKKWQIFLYSLSRFEKDTLFRVMNGLGQLLMDCIYSFPEAFEDYKKDKATAKEKLRLPMVSLCEKLQDIDRLKAFISKSMFNGGEVNYLTILHDNKFHVFWSHDVINVMGANLKVTNSRALQKGQFPEQKVVFKYNSTNLAELEMRNDSDIHYREIRFNMNKPKALHLLFDQIRLKQNYNDDVILYGESIKHFGRWTKTSIKT